MHIEKSSTHRGILKAGWTLLSVGYILAFASGIGAGVAWSSAYYTPTYHDPNHPELNSHFMNPRDPHGAAGYALMLPIFGPLVSAIAAPATAYAKEATYGFAWSIPLMLIDLPLQVIGLGLVIKGYRTPQYRAVPNLLSHVNVTPYSTGSGGGVNVSGRF